MTRICVEATVPVIVVVDTETGDVERVVVEDEHVTFTGFCWDLDAPGPINDLRLPPEADEAKRIANNPNIVWPSWDFGW